MSSSMGYTGIKNNSNKNITGEKNKKIAEKRGYFADIKIPKKINLDIKDKRLTTEPVTKIK